MSKKNIQDRLLSHLRLSINPQEYHQWISKSSQDIKDLYLNIKKINKFISINECNYNLSFIKSLIRKGTKKAQDITEINSIVSGYFNISKSDLISKNRSKKLSVPRQIAIYLSKKYIDLSLSKIGSYFGNRNHTTIMYSIKKMEEKINRDRVLKAHLEKLEKLLN